MSKHLLFLLTALVLLSGCHSEPSFCLVCGNQLSRYDDLIWEDLAFCRDCVDEDLSKCLSCGSFFSIDYVCTAEHYCVYCAEEHTVSCCSCGSGWLEQNQRITVDHSGQTHHLCAPCATEYFREATAAQPLDCCIAH